jgi:hypothetical protein
MRKGRLFINYRRDDSRADSGRLYDRLSASFPGRVFRDVASLEPGVEWDDAISRVLGQSDACVVVIGKNWLTITDASGRRRLDDPRDTVRREILVALQRQMRVFPVLVGGAKMPAEEELPAELQSLSRRHAIELNEQDWDEDVQKLIKALETALGPSQDRPGPKPSFSRRGWVFVVAGAVGAVIALAVYNAANKPASGGANQPTVSTSQERRDPAPQQSQRPVSEEPRAPIRAPRPAVDTAQLAGNWRAVVSSSGRELHEVIEVFSDQSFRVRFQGNTAAVGRWHYNAGADSLEITDSTNFMNNGIKFSCTYRPADDAHEHFKGDCIDRMRNSWSVSLMRAEGSPDEDEYDIPRVDVSGLSTAERAAFTEILSGQRCTCNCGLSLLVCLRKDLTCQFSPNLASIALAAFLRLTRA